MLQAGHFIPEDVLLGANPHIAHHFEIAGQCLVAIDIDLARIGLQEAADHLDGGGFASPVGSQQAKDLALLHTQADIIHRFECAEGFADISNFKAGIVQGIFFF